MRNTVFRFNQDGHYRDISDAKIYLAELITAGGYWSIAGRKDVSYVYTWQRRRRVSLDRSW